MSDAPYVRGRTIKETARELCVAPVTVKRKLATGELRAVKVGVKTLVTTESIDAFWASLPPAEYRAPHQKAAA